MVAQTPDWPYWLAVADTHVKLSQCIALSLNINPHLIDFRPGYLGNSGLWRLDSSSVKVFRARYRILTAYRQNGECFSVDPPGNRERSVLLTEFAAWALHKFTEPKIPNELAVLATIGHSPLPEPKELANLAAALRPQTADVDPSGVLRRSRAAKEKNILHDIQDAYQKTYAETGKVPSARKVAERSGYDRGTDAFKNALKVVSDGVDRKNTAKIGQNPPRRPAKGSQHLG